MIGPSARIVLLVALVGFTAQACLPRHVVQPGERVRIRTVGDDEKLEGRLVSADSDSVRVESEGGMIVFARGDARSVSFERAQPKWERVLGWLLASTSAGAGIYEMTRNDFPPPADRTLLIGVHAAMAIHYAYRASLEYEWRPAKLPAVHEEER